tara:strand:- start:190 stop:1245 length:1056 start_codon:yes stop_codon:yes gene_type:complete
MKGGDCTYKDNCKPEDLKGNCSLKDYVCCDNGSVVQPDPRSSQNQHSTSSPYSNSVSGTQSASSPSITSGSSMNAGSSMNSNNQTNSSSSGGVTGSLFKASDGDLLSLYKSEIISSQTGVKDKDDDCNNFCGRELRKTRDKLQPDGSVIEEEVDPYYVWRPCTQFCKNEGCPNCGDDDPNDLNKDGILDFSDKNSKVDFIKFTKSESRKDNCEKNSENCCRELSQSECHKNPNCFYCISEGTPDLRRKCTKIDAQGNYVCDERNTSACVPLYKQGNSVVPYTEGPFSEKAQFNFSKEKLFRDDKKDVNVLDYPYLGNCKKPVKETLSLEEQMELMKTEYSSPYSQNYSNPF